ncbi:MAG: peptidoglycan-binding domain-containing protein, partial [Candidatus Paceibacterota bacterium]
SRVIIYDFIKLTTTSLPPGTEDSTYSQTLTTENSQGTVGISLVSGTLPDGLTITGTTISGTPTESGTFDLTLRAEDNFVAIGKLISPEVTITLRIRASGGTSGGSVSSSPVVIPVQLPDCTLGEGINKTTGLPCATATPPPTDCKPGDLFSTSTGNPCPLPLTPTVCTLGALFSTTTGLPCTTSSTPPLNSPSNTSLAFQFLNNLKLGMRHSDVKELQKYLNTHGFIVSLNGFGSTGNETTYFGLKTKAAVIKFQKAKNITPAVGFLGPITRGVMNNVP